MCPVITVDASTTKISLFIVNGTYWEQFSTTISTTARGWQYFGFTLVNNYDSGNCVNTASVRDLNIIPLPFINTGSGYVINESTIGSISSVTTTFAFTGFLRYFDICDDTSSCANVKSTRAEFLANNKITLYEHYWDLTSNTIYDEFKSINLCKRNQELNLDKLSFLYNQNTYPVYPTEKGWFTFDPSTILHTDEITFSNTRQFTFEFEIFPIDSNFWAKVSFESLTNINKFEINLNSSCTYSNNPYSYSSSVTVRSRSWNKVFVTYTRIGSSSVRFLIHMLALKSYGATSQTIASFSVDSSYASSGLFGTLIKPTVSGSRMILKSIKFYLWAMEADTVAKDLGVYSYNGDQDLTFSNNIYSGYLEHFTDNSLMVSSSYNACMNYVTSNTNICADISEKEYETCQTGYNLNSFFCIDKCGDGSVSLTPRTFQCDDGNNNSGDGCSQDCFTESGYQCDLVPNLNNKSYCYPLCGNGKIDTNEECDDLNYLKGDGCTSDCKIELGFKCNNFSTKPSACYPNCVDGVRDTTPYIEECDDRNNFDFDGCSKSCKVEFNYNCNNSTGIDICKTIYQSPVITSSKIDFISNSITVSFSEIMSNMQITDMDINIFVSGPNSPYNIAWSSKYLNKDLIISYTISPSIIGGVGEYIQLELLNLSKFKSIHDIPLQNQKILKFVCGTLEASSTSQSSGSGASYTFVITIVFSLCVSILTGGSMELMWSLANTLQIIFFFGMINLYYSADLKALFSYMSYSNFDNPLTDYISNKLLGYFKLINTSIDTNFANVGFQSNDFISNSLDKIFMIIGILIIIGVIAILYKCCKKRTNWLTKFIIKADLSLRYEYISRFTAELVLNMSISSFINITYGQRSTAEEIIAYIFAVFAMICFFGSLHECFVRKHNDCKGPACLTTFIPIKKFFIIYLFLFQTKLLLYAYFILRRICLAFVFVCLKDYPHIQCILIPLLCLWIVFYHVRYRPYKKTLQNMLSCFNEFILFSFSCLLYIFIKSDNPNRLKIVSYVCIGIIIIFFLVNWTIIFPYMFCNLVQSLRLKCKKKTPQEIEAEEERKSVRIIHIPHPNNSQSRENETPVISFNQKMEEYKAKHSIENTQQEVVIEKIVKKNRKQANFENMIAQLAQRTQSSTPWNIKHKNVNETPRF